MTVKQRAYNAVDSEGEKSSVMRVGLVIVFLLAALAATAGSASATDAPAAPSELTWTPTGITWQDNSDNEDGFRLEKLIFGEWLLATQYPVNATSGQAPSLGYDVGCVIPLRLIAFNSAADSEPSALVEYDPIPTPPPSGCPFTATPVYSNDSSSAANKLILPFPFGWQTVSVSVNPTGCDEPIVTRPPNQYEITWPTNCVDPGESVQLTITGTGPIFGFSQKTWLSNVGAATSTSSPSPPPSSARSSPAPTITPASLPTAGGSPRQPSNAALALVSGAALLLVASLAYKRIR